MINPQKHYQNQRNFVQILLSFVIAIFCISCIYLLLDASNFASNKFGKKSSSEMEYEKAAIYLTKMIRENDRSNCLRITYLESLDKWALLITEQKKDNIQLDKYIFENQKHLMELSIEHDSKPAILDFENAFIVANVESFSPSYDHSLHKLSLKFKYIFMDEIKMADLEFAIRSD